MIKFNFVLERPLSKSRHDDGDDGGSHDDGYDDHYSDVSRSNFYFLSIF